MATEIKLNVNKIPVYGYQYKRLLDLFAEFNDLTDELAVMVGDDDDSQLFVGHMNRCDDSIREMVAMAYAETHEAI